MQQNNKQSGNVFILILMGIFLFAALIYTFTKSSRNSSGNITKEQSKIVAQEILEYSRLMEGAVDHIRRNGCSESAISFNNSFAAGYSNPSAPVDLSCDVFAEEGGNISYADPRLSNWIDTSQSSESGYGDLGFSGETYIGFVNSTNSNNIADLIFWVPFVPRQICIEINKALGVDNPAGIPPVFQAGPHITPYTGTFANTHLNQLTGATTPVLAACAQASGTNLIAGDVDASITETYHYYHVILPR